MGESDALDATERIRLLSALGWWVEAGIDVLVDNDPRDWFAPAAPSATPPPVTGGSPVETTAPAAAAIASAPLDARSVEALHAAIESFQGCPLRTPGLRTVFADGNPDAGLMLIGEAPGVQEDRAGLPFVGPAGKLLDRMLAAIGHDRSSAYITNVVYWRPPGNRTPTPEEVETCLPFVRRHVALVKPKLVVALGACATRALTGDASGIMRLRGGWRSFDAEGTQYPLLPMLHPAYLLRQPAAKRFAWTDLLAVKARLDAD